MAVYTFLEHYDFYRQALSAPSAPTRASWPLSDGAGHPQSRTGGHRHPWPLLASTASPRGRGRTPALTRWVKEMQ
ncbi:MAG: hypothetical protein ACLU38_15035 [Dysosmobacter sp.]